MENIVRVESLTELHNRKFYKDTKIIARVTTDAWSFDPGLIDRYHITGIMVEPEGGSYCSSENGDMLFQNFHNHEENVLMYCSGRNRNVTIPKGVTVIGERAFESTNVETVIIPDTVRLIEFFAFRGCSNLKEVTVPPSVENAAAGSFADTEIIHLQKPLYGITCTAAFPNTERSACFCIEYEGNLHILPRDMTEVMREIAEARIFGLKVSQKITPYFKLAATDESRQKCAYETFKACQNPEAKAYLLESEEEILKKSVKKGENALLTFLKAFHEVDLLTSDILKQALKMISSKDWMCARAYVLQESGSVEHTAESLDL